MLPTDLDAITELDLQRLVEVALPEKRTIEYKREFYRLTLKDPHVPAKDQAHQRAQCVELLKDISSFANSLGGHLLIGVEATNGIPKEVRGVEHENIDGLQLQISELAARWIEPRIQFNVHAVPVANTRHVIIIRVHQSMVAPHRVIYGKEPGQFYARNTAGVYSMDTSELRQAFGLSQTISETIRTFRSHRLNEVSSGRGPLMLRGIPSMMVHIVPLASFVSRMNFDAAKLRSVQQKLAPISPTVGSSPRFNLDGICVVDPSHGRSRSYVQIFRNEVIEATAGGVAAARPGANMPDDEYFSTQFVRYLLDRLPGYCEAIRKLEIPGPAWILLSFFGMQKVWIHGHDSDWGCCNQDELILPDVQIEDIELDSADELMRPALDILWNSAGFERCFRYNSSGKFTL